ncbi:DNA-binding transcriptional LysR family regulator [Sphingobium sp. OAS761]|uniref:LysR family transcriptional regulator n=1 Tax=Sphingobium sp. OAS761 TaxID=2817901 RepID=UPI0020A00692|nr:LysR family transcriptional regulator [Sphingobium sp. OAS761]MCP1470242.1 DNA-binding transcriptional LysR family regulator [Sphingobium sp. OAS761]
MDGWAGIDEFVAAALAGSFSAAAGRLGCSVTHISRSVARLEKRLDARLFHRTTRRVTLTDTGQTFLRQAERLVAERDEAIASVTSTGEPQGALRITCSTAMGELFIAPIVNRYAALHPRLSVTMELTNRLVDLIADNFDLAIRTGAMADSQLIRTRIASRSFSSCAAPVYLDRRGRPRTPEDLAGQDCLLGSTSTWHFSVDGRDVIYRPRGRLRVNSGRAVLDAALQGMGICQLPEFYVLPYLRTGALEPVLEDSRPRDEPIWAVYPQRRHLLPKVTALVAMLRRELPKALIAG